MKISFIGAGNVATSLGKLFSQAGHLVKFGVRTPTAEQLSISDACQFGEIVCFAIPYGGLNDLLIAHQTVLKDKVVVDITNPINIKDWSPLFLGEDSGGEQTARLLPASKVVKAFNTIFADVMQSEKQSFDGQKLTTFIASNDTEAAEVIRKLAEEAGFHGLVVGKIEHARHLEAMAHLNIAIALGGGGTEAGFNYFQRK